MSVASVYVKGKLREGFVWSTVAPPALSSVVTTYLAPQRVYPSLLPYVVLDVSVGSVVITISNAAS